MDWDVIAPMVVFVILILTTGAVILLRPLSKRLGELLEVLAQEKRSPSLQRDAAQLREMLATVESRLSLLEERQNFSEALLDPAAARRAPAAVEGNSALHPPRELPPRR